jgi:hypothetical protein
MRISHCEIIQKIARHKLCIKLCKKTPTFRITSLFQHQIRPIATVTFFIKREAFTALEKEMFLKK